MTISIKCGQQETVFHNHSKTRDLTVSVSMADNCDGELTPQYEVRKSNNTITDSGDFDSKKEVITVDVPKKHKLLITCTGQGEQKSCEVEVKVV